MNIDEAHKEKVGKQIILQIAQALSKEQVEPAELQYVCGYLLQEMPKITTQEQLIGLLTDLSNNWDILSPLLTIEKGAQSELVTKQQAATIEELLKQNKVDEAHQQITQ